MTRGNWLGQIVKSGGEKLGRWTYITMQGKLGENSPSAYCIESTIKKIMKITAHDLMLSDNKFIKRPQRIYFGQPKQTNQQRQYIWVWHYSNWQL